MLLLALFACGGAADSDTSGSECASQHDYSNLPELAGEWTTSFAQDFYDGQCAVGGFDANTEGWISTFTIAGDPASTLYGVYADEDEKFMGAEDANGGVTFTGNHVESVGTVHATFSGQAYADQYLDDKLTIDGLAFLGLDVDGDGVLDCYARGSWGAKKSGT